MGSVLDCESEDDFSLASNVKEVNGSMQVEIN